MYLRFGKKGRCVANGASNIKWLSNVRLCKTPRSVVFKADLFLTQMTFTFSICSFSAANSETEPKTNLNSLRYRLESSTLEPISGRRSRRYSTKMVAKRAEVVGFAKKELATIYKRKPQRTYYCCHKKNKGINALSIKKNKLRQISSPISTATQVILFVLSGKQPCM